MIKRFLMMICLLNVFDAFATFVGLSMGTINELNPLMDKIYNTDPLLFLGVKFTLSLLLLFILFLDRIPKANYFTILSAFAMSWYVVICSMHFIWMIGNFIQI